MDWQLGIYEGGGWNAIFWCNHDQPRVVSRFGDDSTESLRQASSKTLAIALHMLQGTPYIYQGEEIGMTNPHFNSIDAYRDVESLNAYDYLKNQGYKEQEILEILDQKSRDNSRTPMQWNASNHAGFTTGEPWINIPQNYQHINVEEAMKDSESILHTYKTLISLRHHHDIITYGNIEPMYMEHEQLFVYRRHYHNQTWLIIANFSREPVMLPEDLNVSGDVIIQNGTLEQRQISGFGAMVVETAK